MRARLIVLTGFVVLIGAASAIQACGDTEPIAPVDAGPDVVVDSGPQKEAAPDEADAAHCDTTADFTESIPDASIADGASTTGLCIQCANKQCPKFVDDCNKDCECQGIAGKALDCYLKNPKNPTVCAAGFGGVSSETQQLGYGLLQCINGKCKDECATSSFQDAGKDAAKDATPE